MKTAPSPLLQLFEVFSQTLCCSSAMLLLPLCLGILLTAQGRGLPPVVARRAHSDAEVRVRADHRRRMARAIIVPWMYFMAVNMNLPNLPKFINSVVNQGDPNVSGESQKMYGNLSGLDAFFTFLSVSAVGRLSDVYGRKPFMMYSALGLGLGYFLCSLATSDRQWVFYISGSIDGLTSCMFSQSQAYISDLSAAMGESLSLALSQFQGLAIGLAFMLGIPLGAQLGSRYSLRTPLFCSMGFCFACFLSVLLFLPESASRTSHIKDVKIHELNPAGAVSILLRTKTLSLLSLVYFLANVAHAGIQVMWINYLQLVFGWSPQISSLTLAIIGLTVAAIPRLYIPVIGTKRSITYGLLIHSVSLVLIGEIYLGCI